MKIEIDQKGKLTYHFDDTKGKVSSESANSLSLLFTFKQPKQNNVENRVQIVGNEISHDSYRHQIPFQAVIVSSQSFNLQEMAVHLGQLRKIKREDTFTKALKIVEPNIISVESNYASGAPMIRCDVGLAELVPLPVMGEGMVRIARLILAITKAPNGIVLIDEIENGLHHTILEEIWRFIEEVAEQNNTQVIATTHSFECVEAANDAIQNDDLLVHRLQLTEGNSECITYSTEVLNSTMNHNLEIR